MVKAPKLHHWRIYLIRKRGEFICAVDTPDEKAAIAAAIKEYEITDPERQKLVAQRSGSGNVYRLNLAFEPNTQLARPIKGLQPLAASPGSTSSMSSPLRFQCPDTNQSVLMGGERRTLTRQEHSCLPVQCIACNHIHWIESGTGQVIGTDWTSDPSIPNHLAVRIETQPSPAVSSGRRGWLLLH
jgi:hypothetical protein